MIAKRSSDISSSVLDQKIQQDVEKAPASANNDKARLAALYRYDILDTAPEQGYDDIVLLATQLCGTPVALVSLVADDRQWFKARIGFDPCQTPLSQSVCAHALRQPGLLIIPDLTVDPRTKDNTLVTESPHIRFYAGARLETTTGEAIGTLCVIDTKPRPKGLTKKQSQALEALARQVMALLELRRATIAQAEIHAGQLAASMVDRYRMWRLSTDVMLVADFASTITAVNPAWKSVLGWDESELVGKHFMDLIHPDDSSATLAEVDKLSEGATTFKFENRYRRKDGSYCTFSWTAVQGEHFIHAIGRDVTAERMAQAELSVTQESLRQSQKMEAVGQLTGGLAHDFNNLLVVITGSLELVERCMLKGRVADTTRFIATAQTAASRAAALTHRLLAFSRRQTLDARTTDVNRLITGMDEIVRRTVGPEIAVEIVGATDLWTTLVDPHQLENALLNLCINARDAMPDGGHLTIETANRWLDERAARERDVPVGQYVSMCVSDTGCGMPPDVIERAFEPFFTTKPTGQGTGLGLSMIYGFARQSGGQVRIYSEQGQGTTICLYLPRHHGETDDQTEMKPVQPTRAEHGQTVLVVDDEPSIRMLVVEVLEDLGYGAIEAHDGPSALKILQSKVRIDLLVTDVGLPGGMNGRQIADAGRSSRPDLKILFITGYAENAAIGHGHMDPGMAVMTKPFALHALANRIKDLIASED